MHAKLSHARLSGRTRTTTATAIFFAAAALAACSDLTAPIEGTSPRDDRGARNAPGPSASSYVAVNGSSQNDGSEARPWSLDFALSGADGAVRAGDTIWVRGGTYKGQFRSTVRGASGRPVVVRQYPGERVILDGSPTPSGRSVFLVQGEWSVFWGLEITNSKSGRSTSSLANDVRPNVITNEASHTKYINMIVHDGGVGFYNEPTASDVEVAGCIFYNNGWQGPDRGHGHGLYLKSFSGPVVVRDNIVFNQFGFGIHAYTNEGSGKLNNIRIEGNVAFNNGTISSVGFASNILLGGEEGATASVIRNNFTWFPPSEESTNVRVGYQTYENGSVDVSGNYFVGGGTVLDVGQWGSASIQSNTLVGDASVVRLSDSSPRGQGWRANTYRRDPSSRSWALGGDSYTFAAFRQQTGLGTSDAATDGEPSDVKVVVRKNPHEQGRANIVVYNWSGDRSAEVSLDGIVPRGKHFVVHNVQNMFGTAVASGTYDGGSVSIPLGGVSAPAVIGYSARSPRTGPYFDSFVVRIE